VGDKQPRQRDFTPPIAWWKTSMRVGLQPENVYRKSPDNFSFGRRPGRTWRLRRLSSRRRTKLLRFVASAAGTAGSVQHIQFNGVTFTHTFRTLFSQPYDSLLMSDWRIARAGAVFLQNAENIRIENCTFDQVGGNGVFVNGYNRNHVIFDNTFIDAGASCVALIGLRSSVRCPGSWTNNPACNDKTPGPLTEDLSGIYSVNNNTMKSFGRFEKQTAGVAISMSQCDTIRHNTIHDCPRAGLSTTMGAGAGM